MEIYITEATEKFILAGLVIASLLFIYLLAKMSIYEIVTVLGLIGSGFVFLVSISISMLESGKCVTGFYNHPFLQDNSVTISIILFLTAVASAVLGIRKSKMKSKMSRTMH